METILSIPGERSEVERLNLAVYARRRVRHLFLSGHVEEGHPVLVTENILVEMARSKLLAGLLATLGVDGLSRERPFLEREIREEMKLSISYFVSDPEKMAVLEAQADAETMDSVFTVRGA